MEGFNSPLRSKERRPRLAFLTPFVGHFAGQAQLEERAAVDREDLGSTPRTGTMVDHQAQARCQDGGLIPTYRGGELWREGPVAQVEERRIPNP